MTDHDTSPVKAVILDFGGVLAEEGFRSGLQAIALKQNMDPSHFFSQGESLVYSSGYVTGRSDEATYWKALREKTGVSGSDEALREEILSRFLLRPEMLDCVRRIKRRGVRVAILSDQTNWLIEVDRRTTFFGIFDRVFNSYTLGTSKREAGTFSKVCGMMGVQPGGALFVDDNEGNVRRASAEGLRTVRFLSYEDFAKRLIEHGLEGC